MVSISVSPSTMSTAGFRAVGRPNGEPVDPPPVKPAPHSWSEAQSNRARMRAIRPYFVTLPIVGCTPLGAKDGLDMRQVVRPVIRIKNGPAGAVEWLGLKPLRAPALRSSNQRLGVKPLHLEPSIGRCFWARSRGD